MNIPLVVGAIAAAGSAVAQPANDPLFEFRINLVVERALSERRLVGVVVLVARNGRVVYRHAAGYADREAAARMREDTIFRLASITKPLVTAAAMRLVEEGRLKIDAR